ncbi:MAG: hypothetical protein PWP03_240 [Candidatus Woesearchaeota archaeon]|nr:hypothetical protein [Candidatus Woesearchaeota archaeon]MDN5327602.1 hypothetical protein [Candidatus Woesearchaeota archaeon]
MNHSIALYCGGQAVYSSDGTQIKPLFDLVKKFKGSHYKNCTLYDKVVGLAAARLIVFSNIITKVNAHLISKLGLEYLLKNNIEVEYDILTDKILNHDQTDMCPMEKASLTRTDEEFYNYLDELFNKRNN